MDIVKQFNDYRKMNEKIADADNLIIKRIFNRIRMPMHPVRWM